MRRPAGVQGHRERGRLAAVRRAVRGELYDQASQRPDVGEYWMAKQVPIILRAMLEDKLVELFALAHHAMVHRGAKTLMVQDLRLVRAIRGRRGDDWGDFKSARAFRYGRNIVPSSLWDCRGSYLLTRRVRQAWGARAGFPVPRSGTVDWPSQESEKRWTERGNEERESG